MPAGGGTAPVQYALLREWGASPLKEDNFESPYPAEEPAVQKSASLTLFIIAMKLDAPMVEMDKKESLRRVNGHSRWQNENEQKYPVVQPESLVSSATTFSNQAAYHSRAWSLNLLSLRCLSGILSLPVTLEPTGHGRPASDTEVHLC